MSSRIRVEASASIANFGPGYDSFGLCLGRPTDIIEMELSDSPGIHLEVAEEGFRVPAKSRLNTASVAAKEVMLLANKPVASYGIDMTLLKGVRPNSGLGSSASSAVAGALGAAALFDIDDQKKILGAAAEGEGASSGAPHLDNVAPCLFGGFTVILDHERFQVLHLKPPDMKIIICLPDIAVSTGEARKLIPREIPLKTAVSHVGWASGIVHGMNTGDIALMASCLKDGISVPARKQLIKGFDIARSAALGAGALSFSISGSGPAVFSLAVDNHEEIGQAIVDGFSRANVKSTFFIARPGAGAKIVQNE